MFRLIILVSFLGMSLSLHSKKDIDGVYVCGVDTLKIAEGTCWYISPFLTGKTVQSDTLAICYVERVSKKLLCLSTWLMERGEQVVYSKDSALRDSFRISLDFPNYKDTLRVSVRVRSTSPRASFAYCEKEFLYTATNKEFNIPACAECIAFIVEKVDTTFVPVHPMTGGYYGSKWTGFFNYPIEQGVNDICFSFPGLDMNFFYRYNFLYEYARILKDGSIVWRGLEYKKVSGASK